MLPQHWVATFRQCSQWTLVPNVGSNIATTFTQPCLNLVSMSVPNGGKCRCHNIAWMLPQHWVATFRQCSWWTLVPTVGSDIGTMFTQPCLNLVSMSVPNGGKSHCHNIAWMLSQHWVATFRQLRGYIATTLMQCCLIVSTLVHNVGEWLSTASTQWCLNVVSMFVLITGSNIATTFTQHWHNVVTMLNNIVAMLGFWLKYNIGTTFTQYCLEIHTTPLGHLNVSTNECCHNDGTNVVPTMIQCWSVS